MKELRKLAERGVDRTFQQVRKNKPLELPLLFEIVDEVCGELWAGAEAQKIDAIKKTIRRAASTKRLSAEPLWDRCPVTIAHAALRLYDLLPVSKQLEQRHKDDRDDRYEMLISILKEESKWTGHGEFRGPPVKVRQELARALEALVTPSLERHQAIVDADSEESQPERAPQPQADHEPKRGEPVTKPAPPSQSYKPESPIEVLQPRTIYIDQSQAQPSNHAFADDLALSLAMRHNMHQGTFARAYYGAIAGRGEGTPKFWNRRTRLALAELKIKFDARIGTAKMRGAARHARWTSPTAYSDLGLDTYEGARNMYRLIMEEAAEAIHNREISVHDVVSILTSNRQRPDISGHDPHAMAEQIGLSADRYSRILAGYYKGKGVRGRVIDEDGEVVPGIEQAAGVRYNAVGQSVAPSLISISEIDAWMRGAIEHTDPQVLAAAHVEAIKVLARQIRERLERTIEAQKQAEVMAAEHPNSASVQHLLVTRELETKRQLAAVDALHNAMRSSSPTKVRYFAEDVLWHALDMGAAGRINIEELINQLHDDREFRRYRRR